MSGRGLAPPLPTSPDSLHACRGVVRLFNAVAKAQRAQREAAGGGARGRAARLSTSGFLAELRRGGPDAPVRPFNQNFKKILNLFKKTPLGSVGSQAPLAHAKRVAGSVRRLPARPCTLAACSRKRSPMDRALCNACIVEPCRTGLECILSALRAQGLRVSNCPGICLDLCWRPAFLQAGAGGAPAPAADALKPSAPKPADGAAGGKGWAVLREGGAGSGLGLAGVPGSGVRMRDWDTRAGSSDEEAAPGGFGLRPAGADDDEADSGDDSGDGAW